METNATIEIVSGLGSGTPHTNYIVVPIAAPAAPSTATGKTVVDWGETLGLVIALLWGIYVSWKKHSNEVKSAKVVGVLKDNIDTAKEVISKVSPAEKESYVATIKAAQSDAGVREEVRKAP